MIVIDVSVFAKLFLPEDDQEKAHELFRHIVAKPIPLIAPTILFYEAASIALRYSVSIDLVLDLFERMEKTSLILQPPTPNEMRLANRIATVGHAKSGYPELFDSIYHAMAIERGGTFVTADRRHMAKTKQFGNIILLADWRPD